MGCSKERTKVSSGLRVIKHGTMGAPVLIEKSAAPLGIKAFRPKKSNTSHAK